MNVFEAFILGILQGVTEFLPVSSSGHLVVGEHLLSLKASELLSFDILLHIATLVAVVLFFQKRIWHVCQGGMCYVFPSWRTVDREFDQKLVPAILISTFITGVIGVIIKDPVEGMRDNLALVGVCFLFTGGLLLGTYFRQRDRITAEERELGMNILLFAAILGIAQGLAILPGISRSGTTICVALLLGSSKRMAVEYSFLLAIPAILGAALLDLSDAQWQISLGVAATGFIAALIAGLASLWLLVWITQQDKLHRFAYYVIPLGFFVIWHSRY